VIGLGGLICPQALGVGYDVIGAMLADNLTLRATAVLMLVKAVIWSVSLGSGTSGGVLAPLLIMGGALGAVEAHWFPAGGAGFWPLVGMGAILGGTMRSPLTGVVFAVELTHDLNMVLPLLVAVSVAHGFTVLVLRRSILTEKVARRGFHVSREYAIDELEILFVRDAMRTSVAVLRADASLDDALVDLAGPRDDRSQHLYPVLDDRGSLVGAASFAELTAWGKEPQLRACLLASLLKEPPLTIFSNETLRSAEQKMAENGVTRLLVVNPAEARHLVGKIALHDLLSARVRHLDEEHRRERVLPWEYILPPRLRPKG